jgi:hypothetical protein
MPHFLSTSTKFNLSRFLFFDSALSDMVSGFRSHHSTLDERKDTKKTNLAIEKH